MTWQFTVYEIDTAGDTSEIHSAIKLGAVMQITSDGTIIHPSDCETQLAERKGVYEEDQFLCIVTLGEDKPHHHIFSVKRGPALAGRRLYAGRLIGEAHTSGKGSNFKVMAHNGTWHGVGSA